MSNFVTIIFQMSIRASLLILIILAVKFVFKKVLLPQIHYLIWFLLFIALTIPYTSESALSMYNIPNYFDTNKLSSESILPSVSNEKDVPPKSQDLEDIQYNRLKQNTQKDKRILTFEESLTKKIMSTLSWIWLFGGLFVLFSSIIKNIQLHDSIRNEEEIYDEKILTILNHYKKQLNIQTNVKLIKTRQFSTPSLVGILKPRILIPAPILSNLDETKLGFIILHELSHLKRKDILTNWIILVFQSLYWFNPLIWIGFYRMKMDMEIACDTFVLNKLHKKHHIPYGKVIIELLEYFSYNKFSPIITNILQNKSEVERRIIMIKNFRKNSYVLMIISLLLVALVGCTTLTNATKNESTTNTEDYNVQMITENYKTMIYEEEEELTLTYPQVVDFQDKQIEQKVNNIIKDWYRDLSVLLAAEANVIKSDFETLQKDSHMLKIKLNYTTSSDKEYDFSEILSIDMTTGEILK
ncbi:M56 family metallopeptidase [Anaeromicrobium sediminis]|nr:M56 family metallopeptidase [Anaeromicrobium sediminis]